MDSLRVEHRGTGPLLVMAHGFTQTGRLWGPFGDQLAATRRLALVDLPGHAGSSAVVADLPAGGVGLTAVAGDEPFDLLGYSLGGRFVLHAAQGQPAGLRRLVLLGTSPGIEDDVARAERRRRDDAMADELDRSGDVAGFMDRWLAHPMFDHLPAAAAGVEERRRNTAAGLASSLRQAGVGTQRSLWPTLGRLGMPTLVVAGAADLRFGATGVAMARALPHATLSLVPGAGHAVHLEQPEVTARIVTTWLDRTEAVPPGPDPAAED